MSRPKFTRSSRIARPVCPRCLALVLALLGLAVIATAPRPARATFDQVVRAPEMFNVGGAPTCIAVGDLNGDGLPDLVVGTDSHAGIAILLHYGTGFYPALYRPAVIDTLGFSHQVTAVQLADMNKDGNLDAVVAVQGVGVAVLLGDGRGNFGYRTIYPDPAGQMWRMAVGDVNGDGWPDVVIDESPSPGIQVLLGTGGGALGAVVDTPLEFPLVGVQDMTADGIADIVTAYNNEVTISPGSPAGTFTSSLPPDSLVSNNATDFVDGVSIGDLNGDSVPDLVYSWTSDDGTSYEAQHIGVRLGTGGGGFQAPVTYASVLRPGGQKQLLFTDMDGDGKLDVVIIYGLPDTYTAMEVMRGSGTGTLSAGTLYGEPSLIASAVPADINGDGRPDLAAVLKDSSPSFRNGHSIAVYMNDESGGFAQPVLSALGLGQPTLPLVADFNHDGKPDLALADLVARDVEVAPGDGSGTFVSGSLATMPSPVVSMTAGDFDRNGTVDLVTSDIYDPIQFISGSPTGVLASPISAGAGGITHPRSMADMNRDGIPDLVVDAGSGQVAVLRGLGNGTFLPLPPQFLSVGSLNDLVIGDWNRDGYPDLAGASSAGLGVMLGGPGGTLSAVNQLWIGMNWTAVCAGDFNRDGILDLAARVSTDSLGTGEGIYIWLGNGSGNFTLGQIISTFDPRGYTIEAVDVNHDGKLDLVTEGVFYSSSEASPDAEVEVHLGHGDGTFDGIPWATGLIGTMNPPYWPGAVADVDGDGTPDAIASIATWNGVQISTLHINSSSKGNGLLPASFYPTVTAPRSVAVADMNRDGKLDVVTCTPNATPGVAVHLGGGDGTLGASNAVAGSGPTSKVVISDFNRDGIPDIAALNNTTLPYGIVTTLGTGDGIHFSPFPHKYLFNAGLDFAVGDMNRDGIPDIVAATPDSVVVLLGQGDGSFVAGPLGYGVALPSCSHIELADLNHDGYLDVICACGSVKVCYGRATGLQPPVTLSAPITTCQTLCVADLNRDGFLDIAANQGGQWYVLWGAAVSPFSTSAVSTLPFAPNDVKEGDAEANGTPYLYAARNPDQVEVLSVSPTGAIASVGSYVVKSQPGALALGDFNRDGGLDVVSASPVDSTVAINLHGAGSVTAVDPVATLPPAHTRLLQNFPNPFNPRTTIRYALSREERVRLAVFDVRGRLVATLRDGLQAAGEHSVPWDGRDSGGEAVGSGVYFYRLTTASGERESKSMVILK